MSHQTNHHMNKALALSTVRHDMKIVNGFNAKFAVLITSSVGTMWCAYIFAAIALLGLGPALQPGGMGFVPWFAQTFLQLVLLSVIMVGQSVQSAASDARAAKTFADTELLVDKMNEKTEGGIKAVLDAIEELKKVPATTPRTPRVNTVKSYPASAPKTTPTPKTASTRKVNNADKA